MWRCSAIRILAATVALEALPGAGLAQSNIGHWVSISPEGGIVRALAVDPRTPSTIYAGGGTGVFKSVDGGASWAFSGVGGSSVFALAIDPTNTSTVYAGTGGGPGVSKSTDGGTTWDQSSTGLTDNVVSSVAVDPRTSGTVYAATVSGVFKSTDGAASWSSMSNGLGAQPVNALAVDPKSPSTIYAGTQSAGVFRSTDGAATWTASTNGLTPSLIDSLAIDPTTSSTIYAGTSAGLFKSTDAAASWTSVGGQAANFSALAIDPAAPSTVYGGTGGQVLKSVNGVGRWERAMTGLPVQIVWALAIDPVTPSNLYVGTATGIFKSTDAGVSGAASNSGFTPLTAYALAVDPAAPSTIYVGGETGIFKSVDGGKSWTLATNTLPNVRVWSLVVVPGSSAILAGTDSGGYLSTDGGVTWRQGAPQNPNPYAYAIDPRSPSTVYAVGGIGPSRAEGLGAIAYSADGGLTWPYFFVGDTGTFPPVFNAAVVNPPSSLSPLTIGTDKGIWWTSVGLHGGLHLVASGQLEGRRLVSVAEDPVSRSIVYAGTAGSGLFKSTDGGMTFGTQVTNGLTATGIFTLLFGPDSPSTFYAGTSNGVFVSADAGASWMPMNLGLTKPRVNALAQAPGPGGALYAATNGAGVFLLSHELGPCVPSDTVLCLSTRFQVTAEWRKTDGSSGSGTAIPLTSDTGYFWFFDPTNVEVITKVLNGCAIGNHYWVFAAGLTNVGVTLTYTDMAAGVQKPYPNPVGSAFSPIQDTSAFATCP